MILLLNTAKDLKCSVFKFCVLILKFPVHFLKRKLIALEFTFKYFSSLPHDTRYRTIQGDTKSPIPPILRMDVGKIKKKFFCFL